MKKEDLIIKQLVDNWESKTQSLDKLFDFFGETSAHKEIAPGRNKVIFLLGHLTNVHDNMIEAIGLGNRLYPELEPMFSTAQNEETSYPDFVGLRQKWVVINRVLSGGMAQFTSDDWLSKHAYVSAADFEKEPHRNKLAILMSRSSHMSNHYGQLLLAKSK